MQFNENCRTESEYLYYFFQTLLATSNFQLFNYSLFTFHLTLLFFIIPLDDPPYPPPPPPEDQPPPPPPPPPSLPKVAEQTAIHANKQTNT